MIHVHVLYRVCAIKGTTIKYCMSGSQNYLILPTVGYPTCSDKWRPDKRHLTVLHFFWCYRLGISLHVASAATKGNDSKGVIHGRPERQ